MPLSYTQTAEPIVRTGRAGVTLVTGVGLCFPAVPRDEPSAQPCECVHLGGVRPSQRGASAQLARLNGMLSSNPPPPAPRRGAAMRERANGAGTEGTARPPGGALRWQAPRPLASAVMPPSHQRAIQSNAHVVAPSPDSKAKRADAAGMLLLVATNAPPHASSFSSAATPSPSSAASSPATAPPALHPPAPRNAPAHPAPPGRPGRVPPISAANGQARRTAAAAAPAAAAAASTATALEALISLATSDGAESPPSDDPSDHSPPLGAAAAAVSSADRSALGPDERLFPKPLAACGMAMSRPATSTPEPSALPPPSIVITPPPPSAAHTPSVGRRTTLTQCLTLSAGRAHTPSAPSAMPPRALPSPHRSPAVYTAPLGCKVGDKRRRVAFGFEPPPLRLRAGGARPGGARPGAARASSFAVPRWASEAAGGPRADAAAFTASTAASIVAAAARAAGPAAAPPAASATTAAEPAASRQGSPPDGAAAAASAV